jgi:hypothetical protein
VWLRLPTIDTTAEQILIDWVNTNSWQGSFDFLTDHAATLLTDRIEASLEHRIDNNPDNPNLDQHLDILRGAREHGVETVRSEFLNRLATERLATHLTQWINTTDWAASAKYLTAHTDDLLTDNAEQLLASNIEEQPGLLCYLGLLGLARHIGVDEAHAFITDPASVKDATAMRSPAEQLAHARLIAGLDEGSAESQFAHALAALKAGAEAEAVWAITRCRNACASWERSSFARRLEEFTNTHAEFNVAALHQALIDTAET